MQASYRSALPTDIDPGQFVVHDIYSHFIYQKWPYFRVIEDILAIHKTYNPYPNSKLGIFARPIYTARHQKVYSYQRSTTMTTATKSFNHSSTNNGLGAKLAQAAYAVAATVLMLDLRESLAAQTSGDQSDAAFTHGL
jgi:hypothetical protein